MAETFFGFLAAKAVAGMGGFLWLLMWLVIAQFIIVPIFWLFDKLDKKGGE